MSTDYSIGCRQCKKERHFGQIMAGRWSFGFGSGDRKAEEATFAFIEEHYTCDEGQYIINNSQADIFDNFEDVTRYNEET